MKSIRMCVAAACAMLAANPAPALADDRAVDHAAIEQAIEADYDNYLAPLFVEFHQNPELSFLETRTAARMAAGSDSIRWRSASRGDVKG